MINKLKTYFNIFFPLFSMLSIVLILSCSKDDDAIEINNRDQFFGNYNVTSCGLTNDYSNNILPLSSNKNRITFSNFGGLNSIEQPYAIVTLNTFNIPSQTYENGTITVNGSGVIIDNIITIQYYIEADDIRPNTYFSCEEKYTK